MSDLWFPERWPAQHPERIQLYSLATPNGMKLGIMLEESELPYEAHLINIMKDEQFDEDFKKINPNSKIPALIDPNGPDGKPIHFMESGAMMIYLAEKTGKLLSTDPTQRWQTIQWLFFQMASIGPMFGQFGHFYKFAKGKTDSYGEERYTKETIRLLKVLDKKLGETEYLAGDDYSIADIATFPWVGAFNFYEAFEAVNYYEYKNVIRWHQAISERPAVQRGVKVCAL